MTHSRSVLRRLDPARIAWAAVGALHIGPLGRVVAAIAEAEAGPTPAILLALVIAVCGGRALAPRRGGRSSGPAPRRGPLTLAILLAIVVGHHDDLAAIPAEPVAAVTLLAGAASAVRAMRAHRRWAGWIGPGGAAVRAADVLRLAGVLSERSVVAPRTVSGGPPPRLRGPPRFA